MISFRKADLIDRLNKKRDSKKRIIYFFNDERNNIKYYDKNTGHINNELVDINFREMFGFDWKLLDFDDFIVAIDNAEANKRLGQDVYCNNEILGIFQRITMDGMMEVIDGLNRRIVDPTEYCIYKREGVINIEVAAL